MAKKYTKREIYKRRERMKILANLADFFGTVASFLAILACVVLLTTLVTWFREDIAEVFQSLLGPLATMFQ